MKTKRDFYREISQKYGIVTSSMFHENLDEIISDEEYEKKMELTSSINDLFDSKFDDDDDL